MNGDIAWYSQKCCGRIKLHPGFEGVRPGFGQHKQCSKTAEDGDMTWPKKIKTFQVNTKCIQMWSNHPKMLPKFSGPCRVLRLFWDAAPALEVPNHHAVEWLNPINCSLPTLKLKLIETHWKSLKFIGICTRFSLAFAHGSSVGSLCQPGVFSSKPQEVPPGPSK